MLISIVIPLYNKEKFIKNTIISVLRQSYKKFELIIVDDGSTDNSVNVVKSISDSRIRIISKQNEGVSKTRNRGVKEAKGEYIFFLDADDYLVPEALKTLYNLMKSYPKKDIYVASYIEKNDVGLIHKKNICKISGNVYNPLKSLWKREISSRVGCSLILKNHIFINGGFRTDISLYEDFDFIVKMEEHASLACSKDIILEYRRGNEGLSFKKVPIEHELVGSLILKNYSGYRKKIMADYLFRRFLKHFFLLNIKAVFKILKNNGFYIIYAMIMFLWRGIQTHRFLE